MSFRVWILEAMGKKAAFKAALTEAGYPRDRVLATCGRLLDLSDGVVSITPAMLTDPREIEWKEIRPGQIRELLRYCEGASEVILATDADLEGEQIAQHFSESLSGTGITFSRAILQGISAQHIKKALDKKTTIDLDRVCAAMARRLFDRELGFQLVDQEDHFAMSMGRVISPLIQSLVENPPLSTRIECELEGGWVLALCLPTHLSDEAATLCAALGSLVPVLPNLVSEEPLYDDKKPLIGPEAVLLCANKTSLTVASITESLQSNYMKGSLSYPRTDSRQMGEIANKWAQRLAQKAGEPFNPEVLKDKQSESLEGAFDAHEAILPLTDKMIGKNSSVPGLSHDDQVLAVITDHCTQLGQEPKKYTLQRGVFGNDERSMRWKELTRRYLKYASLERVCNADGISIKNSLVKISRTPDLATQKVKMWKDAPDLIAAKRLTEMGLGRPSTLAIMASKAKDKYLDKNGDVNGRGRLMLSKVRDRCPLLLQPGVAKRIEGHLVSAEPGQSLSARLKEAWSLIRKKPITSTSDEQAPLPTFHRPGDQTDESTVKPPTSQDKSGGGLSQSIKRIREEKSGKVTPEPSEEPSKRSIFNGRSPTPPAQPMKEVRRSTSQDGKTRNKPSAHETPDGSL
jgi:DNA topoisomerase IA